MERSLRFPAAMLAAVTLALPADAAAQSAGEWSSFQPAPAKAAAPAPAKAAAPAKATAEPAKPAATVPAAGPAAKAPSAQSAAKPAAKAPPAPAASTSKEVSAAPADESHSPSTIGNSFAARANARLTGGLDGPGGLLRTSSAQLGRAGVVRLSLFGEYFKSADFPVLGARDTRTAGTLALDVTLLDYLGAFVTYGASANTNSEASPNLMQAQGDINFGLKGGTRLLKGFWAGAELRGQLLPAVGAQELSNYAFGFAPRLLATVDVRDYAPSVPVRLHLNFGGQFDNSKELMSGNEPTPTEEYALGVHRYDRLTFGAGLEAPLPWVTPFVEYGVGYPLEAKDLIGPDDQPVTVGSSMPQRLTLGLKLTAVRDLSVTAAVDVGLARYVARGIPATQPYNVILGVGYAFEPLARPESKLVERTTVVEKKVEVATAAPSFTGKVAGTVLDAKTRQPLPGVIVAMVGSGLPPVASDAEGGKFLSHDLPAGKVQLAFSREGYKPAALETLVEAGKVGSLQAWLVREEAPKPAAALAVLKVALSSGKQKVAGKVTLAGPKPATLTASADGQAQTELPKGRYVATVEADGYLSKIKDVEVPETGAVQLDLELEPTPKKVLVVVKKDRIEIKQQVHFGTNKAVILADSFQLLDQVVDAIVRSNIKKLRVEGHTDNQGGKDKNLKLSTARAEAVMEYLVKKGIEPSRISAEGFGDSRPIAPNLTARGRELNRRVEFVIAEH